MTNLLFYIVLIVVILIGLVYFFLYIQQEKILFQQRSLRYDIDTWINQTYPNSKITIIANDGIKLQGWFLQKTPNKPVVIYFGGNIEEVSGMAYHFERFNDCSLLLINYRGYGLSEGKPSEQNFFNDATAIFDTIIQRQDVDKKSIIAMGRSIGTGVAVYLAKHRPLSGVILASPYDSMVRVVQRHLPFVPIKLLLKHPFNSISLADSITTPMLALVAKQDTLIPPIHSYNLANKWAGVHEIELIEHANHDNIPDNEIYWNAIRNFLTKLDTDNNFHDK